MTAPPFSLPLRVTFDSNVWQMIVMPGLATRSELFADFTTIHEAVCANQVQGFVSETVGTLEAVRNAGRKAYFTSIKPNADVTVDVKDGQALLTINIGTNHEQHPGLHKVVKGRLDLAITLGMRLMRAPRMSIPVSASFLDLSIFADKSDVPTSAARDNRWGDILGTIEQRGVGSAVLRSLEARAGNNAEAIGDRDFARAVAEWADGDSVAAHVAYDNDIFCTEDQGKSAGGRSILDQENRQWLTLTHNVNFATVRELANWVRSNQTRKS
jgi:hypothetical protein